MKRVYSALVAVVLLLLPSSLLAQESYSRAFLTSDGQLWSGTFGNDRQGALYEAGSIGKFACTLAMLRLIDRGHLRLDDRLGELLPQLAGSEAANVSLRQVLQSRSGVADDLLPAFQQDPAEVMGTPDAATAVERYASRLAAEPGSIWSYDLVNWILAQAVLEHETGMPIAEILQNEVLAPAGMADSLIFIGAIGDRAQPPVTQGRPIPAFLTCAGGLATTPVDLIRLVRFAHKGGLSEASLAALMEVSTPEEGYSLGGRFETLDDGRVLSWQSGSNGAYKSIAVYDPDSDTGFAAMTAQDDWTAIEAERMMWLARP